MNPSRYLIAALAAAITVGTAEATPSTQIWIPSTDVQTFLNPHLGWDVYVDGAGSSMISNGGVTVGVLPFEKAGLEVGIDYRGLSGDHRYPIYLNAKLGLREDALFTHMPALAIGGYDFGFSGGINNYNLVYGLAAKTVWKLGRVSAGYYYSVGDRALMAGEMGGVLLSWDRTLTELTDKLWLALDYQGSQNGYGAMSAGFAWLFSPNASVILGYTRYNLASAGSTVTVQFDLNLF